jgi:hypothetical protein
MKTDVLAETLRFECPQFDSICDLIDICSSLEFADSPDRDVSRSVRLHNTKPGTVAFNLPAFKSFYWYRK